MPKLSDPRITKGHAIAALLNLYRNDRKFVQELDEIRDPYLDLIIQCALDSFASGRKSGLLPREFFDNAIERAKNMQEGAPFFPEASVYVAQLQPYLDALNKLAYRWKLRISWAVPMLVIFDMFDVLRIKGLIPDEIDMPLAAYTNLYPWPAPQPPLEITVPAWALILHGRAEVLTEIGKNLKEYEDKLRTTGLAKYPHSIKKHAKWWFEHFVHGKNYDDIAQDETHTPDGSLISYARNVGEAVRKFSKLIGIDVKNLKNSS